MSDRLWEVDTARGFALALMLLFNWSFALRFLDVVTIVSEESWLYWWAFPRFIGFLFIFIVGVSLTLSVNRLRTRNPDSWRAIGRRKYPARGLRIFGLALGITVVTFVLYPDRYIYFGVLHLIGVSIVLALPFLVRKWEALVGGLAAIAIAVWTRTVVVDSRLLAAVGFEPTVSTLDYFPIFPWFGVVLLGIWTGHVLFPAGARRFEIGGLEANPVIAPPARGLQFVGRHTLVLYLVHQPALGLVLLLLGVDVL